jgi:hypothetical protein
MVCTMAPIHELSSVLAGDIVERIGRKDTVAMGTSRIVNDIHTDIVEIVVRAHTGQKGAELLCVLRVRSDGCF